MRTAAYHGGESGCPQRSHRSPFFVVVAADKAVGSTAHVWSPERRLCGGQTRRSVPSGVFPPFPETMGAGGINRISAVLFESPHRRRRPRPRHLR